MTITLIPSAKNLWDIKFDGHTTYTGVMRREGSFFFLRRYPNPEGEYVSGDAVPATLKALWPEGTKFEIVEGDGGRRVVKGTE